MFFCLITCVGDLVIHLDDARTRIVRLDEHMDIPARRSDAPIAQAGASRVVGEYLQTGVVSIDRNRRAGQSFRIR